MKVRNTHTVVLIVQCLCFALLINAENDSSCPGPKRYYDEIGCKPVFKTPDAKCPERYDCEQLNDLPADKCFYNGHLYDIGERPRDEDKIPCTFDCKCSMKQGRRVLKRAQFSCPLRVCTSYVVGLKPGCYEKRNTTTCCRGPIVCPKKDEDIPICVVDGKTYRDGDYFEPATEPDKMCHCGEGYTGNNVEPFCEPRPTVCGAMLRRPDAISENCIPVYAHGTSPQTDCFQRIRCQHRDDSVIRRVSFNESKFATNEPIDPDMQCKFGNLRMRVGDTLRQDIFVSGTNIWYKYECGKCVCEVPPVPTCRRISDEECKLKIQKLADLYGKKKIYRKL